MQGRISGVNVRFSKYLEGKEKKGVDTEVDRNVLQLQPMKMPRFDGNLRNYPRFKSDLKKLIYPRMKDEETCWYVLKYCLDEDPLSIVKNVDALNETWSRLDARYGRPSKMVDVVMNDVKNLEVVKEGNDEAFIKLIDVVESACRDLLMVKMEAEISNSSCVSLIEEKLPEDIKRQWCKCAVKIDNAGGSNCFPELLTFLNEQRKIIEYNTSPSEH